MKNTYEVEVKAQCPVNPGDTDVYQFKIEAETMIKVEEIATFFAKNARRRNIFQEALTRQCAVTLGAKVTSVGWHGDIKVTCEAP